MAMAFAPAALKAATVFTIDDHMVVTKSYPKFWEDLKTAGFSL
jgi:3-phosphoshikimate 1-carboxyvinyltransferase